MQTMPTKNQAILASGDAKENDNINKMKSVVSKIRRCSQFLSS
jgi:hypothetical protein